MSVSFGWVWKNAFKDRLYLEKVINLKWPTLSHLLLPGWHLWYLLYLDSNRDLRSWCNLSTTALRDRASLKKKVVNNGIGDSQRTLEKLKSCLIKVTARRCLQSAGLVLIVANCRNQPQSWLLLYWCRTTRQVNQLRVSRKHCLEEPLGCRLVAYL